MQNIEYLTILADDTTNQYVITITWGDGSTEKHTVHNFIPEVVTDFTATADRTSTVEMPGGKYLMTYFRK